MSAASLDYLGGRGQQRFRDGEAERLGGLEVDDKIEFGRLYHGQISRFLASENAARVKATLAKKSGNAGAIAHQPSGLHGLYRTVDNRYPVLRGQPNELLRTGN